MNIWVTGEVKGEEWEKMEQQNDILRRVVGDDCGDLTLSRGQSESVKCENRTVMDVVILEGRWYE